MVSVFSLSSIKAKLNDGNTNARSFSSRFGSCLRNLTLKFKFLCGAPANWKRGIGEGRPSVVLARLLVFVQRAAVRAPVKWRAKWKSAQRDFWARWSVVKAGQDVADVRGEQALS